MAFSISDQTGSGAGRRRRQRPRLRRRRRGPRRRRRCGWRARRSAARAAAPDRWVAVSPSGASGRRRRPRRRVLLGGLGPAVDARGELVEALLRGVVRRRRRAAPGLSCTRVKELLAHLLVAVVGRHHRRGTAARAVGESICSRSRVLRQWSTSIRSALWRFPAAQIMMAVWRARRAPGGCPPAPRHHRTVSSFCLRQDSRNLSRFTSSTSWASGGSVDRRRSV